MVQKDGRRKRTTGENLFKDEKQASVWLLCLSVPYNRTRGICTPVMETESHQVVFGKSIIVPSVRELVKEPITKVPPRYVHNQQDLQMAAAAAAAADIWLQSVPVIDLHCLLHGDSMGSELERLHSACKDWGFFQVLTFGPDKGLGWAWFDPFDSCS